MGRILSSGLIGLVLFTLAVVEGAQPTVTIPSLVQALGSADAKQRLLAIDTLGQYGKRAAAALPALRALLGDQSPTVRAHAAKALGRIGDPSAIAALTRLLDDSDPLARREAIQAVYRLNPAPDACLPMLARALEDPDLSVRIRVLNVLADMGEPAVPLLVRQLGRPSMTYWACLALGEIGPKAEAAVPALVGAVKSQEPGVRREAILALASIGKRTETAAPVVAEGLDDPATIHAATYALATFGSAPAEAEAKIRGNVAHRDGLLAALSVWALARLHRDDAEMLQQATQTLVEFLQSTDQETRSAAARALADLNPQPELAVPLLEKALQGADQATVADSLQPLAKLGHKAIPALVAALKHENLRPKVIGILGRMGPAAKPAVPALVELLNDPNHRTHDEVLFALAEIGPAARDAVPAIVRTLNNQQDVPTRYGAAYALGKIGPQAMEAKPALMDLLQDQDQVLSLVAFWALAKVDPACSPTTPDMVPMLIQQLGQPAARQRLEAAISLRCLGPAAKAAVPALKKALTDRNQLVRDMATDALGVIGSG